jgi:hypothetical protein
MTTNDTVTREELNTRLDALRHMMVASLTGQAAEEDWREPLTVKHYDDPMIGHYISIKNQYGSGCNFNARERGKDADYQALVWLKALEDALSANTDT